MAEPSRWPHTGAILAGGASTRIGSPKHALSLPDGSTMIEAVATALGAVCERLVVVGEADALPDLAHIVDLRSAQGPLGGIEALLASDIDTQYLVCPCDLPFATSELFSALLRPTQATATVLRLDGSEQIEPLPARISAEALDATKRLLDEGRRAVFQLMEAMNVEEIPAPNAWSKLLTNVNTPQEYAALAQRTPSDSA